MQCPVQYLMQCLEEGMRVGLTREPATATQLLPTRRLVSRTVFSRTA